VTGIPFSGKTLSGASGKYDILLESRKRSQLRER
jgi:hypothetical protein